MVNYVVNVTINYLLGFYIFKSEWIKDDYIKMCKCHNPNLGLVRVRAKNEARELHLMFP